MENAFVFQRKTDNYGKLFSVIPSIAKFFPTMSDYKHVRVASKGLYGFYAVIIIKIYKIFNPFDNILQIVSFYFKFYLQKIVDEQIRTYDENHERHFIDMYIKKIRQAEANPNQSSSFSCNIHDTIYIIQMFSSL